ncbi:MAG: hypothetical protein JWM37_384 [Candidatus Saccharibacteria bacterium]|nr:hypothetical protein [Candidatus Saccharibacteria bacterium]
MNHKRLGGLLWIANFQYFIVQAIVASAWQTPFSLRTNTISDLGNTVCGPYGQDYVCSPLHVLMNVSFICLGLTMIIGATLLMRGQTTRHRTGLFLLAIAGVGTILVGLFPENGIGALHAVAAALPFVLGNVALLLLANHPLQPRWLRMATYVSAIIALLCLVGFLTGYTPVLLKGGIERIVAYPQTIWMMAFGFYAFRRVAK